MQFLEACYTVVSYALYILLKIYTITILATFRVTIFEFFHPGPQPTSDLSIRFSSSEVFYLAIVNKVLRPCHSWLARQ